MEIVAAALLPPLLFVGLSRAGWFPSDLRKALYLWFVPLTLVWLAPCWLTGGSPAPFDFVVAQFSPWQASFPGLKPGNPLLSDPVLQFVPWREVVVSAWRHGELPFIDATAGAGAALWSNPQAAVLHPLTLLGICFSGFAWPVFVASAKLLVACSGTYQFLRGEEASHDAAALGAVAYGFGAFSIAFLLYPHTNVTSLLPWLLVAVARCGGERGWRAAAAGALLVLVMVSGGHPESLLHVALVAGPLAARTLWRCPASRRLAVSARIAAAVATGVLLSAPLVLPFVHMLPSMERVADLERAPGMAWAPRPTLENASAFVVPAILRARREPMWQENFNEVATQYVGLGALVLALTAVAVAPRRRSFWWALWLALIPLAFRFEAVEHVVASIPVLGTALHGRVRFVLGFVAAVLAAHGWDCLVARPRLARWLVVPTVAAVLAFTIGRFHQPGVLPGAAAALAAALALLAFAGRPPLRRLAAGALFVDLAALMIGFHPPVSRAHYYPATAAIRLAQSERRQYRVASVGRTLPPSTAAMFGLPGIGAHDPTSHEPYLAFLESGGYDRQRYIQLFHSVPPRRMLDLLGVKLVLGPPDLESPELPTVYRGSDAAVLLNPTARPPAYAPGGDTEVRILLHRPAHLEIETNAAHTTTIATTVVNIPGWTLTRNGRPWPIEPRGGVLAGWTAPEGASRFKLEYRPPGLAAGMLIAALALPLLLLMWRWGRPPFPRTIADTARPASSPEPAAGACPRPGQAHARRPAGHRFAPRPGRP
jgi:hypothetical protein